MDLNFEYYKVFYYVSKYGSLTRAANVLMTSQPAVTRTIHNLESELGCRLFIRSKKGVELTPEGRVFYEYISAACAQNGINYSRFMNGLKKAGIGLNRKMLAELAVSDAAAFTSLVEKAKAAL